MCQAGLAVPGIRDILRWDDQSQYNLSCDLLKDLKNDNMVIELRQSIIENHGHGRSHTGS